VQWPQESEWGQKRNKKQPGLLHVSIHPLEKKEDDPYRGRGNFGVCAIEPTVADRQDHHHNEMNDRVVNHPSEGFCQHTKELVDVQNSTQLEPIERRTN